MCPVSNQLSEKLKKFSLLIHNLVTLSLYLITMYYFPLATQNLCIVGEIRANFELSASQLQAEALLKEDELVGNGEWSMHLVSLPGNLHSVIILLCHQAVTHLALAYLACWELLSLNYCSALPLTSKESHFKDLLKFIIAFATENIALHGTWCPINKSHLT